jgi:hypothetical protein
MASVGVEFHKGSLDRALEQSMDYYKGLSTLQPKTKAKKTKWAVDEIYRNNHPLRPWGLGAITSKNSLLYWLSGSTVRHPGQYRHMDPNTERDEGEWYQNTNERIHSSVRIRMACEGLDLNDDAVWKCPALKNWTLKRSNDTSGDPVPAVSFSAVDLDVEKPSAGTQNGIQGVERSTPTETRVGEIRTGWVWEYSGPEKEAHPDPKQRLLVEEPLGPYERYVIKVTGGTPNVYEFAEKSSERLLS